MMVMRIKKINTTGTLYRHVEEPVQFKRGKGNIILVLLDAREKRVRL